MKHEMRKKSTQIYSIPNSHEFVFFMWFHVFHVALVVMPMFHLVLEVKEGTYSDSIVATITDNPDPVEFQLASIGALPKVP